MMTMNLTPRARGIVGVRAEAGNAKAVLEDLQRTFAAFKEERDAEIAALKKGQEDVVRTEKVDRINAEIEKLQKAMDETNALIAAMKIGGDGGFDANPAKAEYAQAFNRWFRKGQGEQALGDLAVKAAMQTDSDPDGGYTVPEEMESGIDRILGTVSAMRSVARVVRISSSVYKRLVNTTGTTSGWVGERESRAETNTPQLSELEFPAMEIYANPAATQRMLDDSAIDIASWLGDEISIEFAEEEGAAFITGNGVNKPRGILSYDTVADASWAWGKLGFTVSGVAADINDASNNGVDALISLTYSLKQGYRQGAAFMMNRTVASKVRKLKDTGDGSDAYLWEPSAKVGQPATLLGYPLIDDDNMSDVGANAFPIAFGNFQRGYLIVDRAGIRVLRDPYTNKPYVHFYTTKRVGGGVSNFQAIKLLKCSA